MLTLLVSSYQCEVTEPDQEEVHIIHFLEQLCTSSCTPWHWKTRITMISLLFFSHFHLWASLGNLMTNIIIASDTSLSLSLWYHLFQSPSYYNSFLLDYQASHLLLIWPAAKVIMSTWKSDNAMSILKTHYQLSYALTTDSQLPTLVYKIFTTWLCHPLF